MKILDYGPIETGIGAGIARIDVEFPNGLRLYNMKLTRSPAGNRVYAPSAFGTAAATFPAELAVQIIDAVASYTGAIAANENRYSTL